MTKKAKKKKILRPTFGTKVEAPLPKGKGDGEAWLKSEVIAALQAMPGDGVVLIDVGAYPYVCGATYFDEGKTPADRHLLLRVRLA